MKTICLPICLLSFSVIAGTTSALGIDLYNDGLGNLPGDQSYLEQNGMGTFSETAVSSPVSGVRLDTSTDILASAGYSNYNSGLTFVNGSFPVLDRSIGYTLSFQLSVLSESHASNDRAGFSVILLSSDQQGIEIGFWEDEIWAQNDSPLFTHGEGAAFDTTAGETTYDLAISGDNYSLSANSSQILTGSLRDYTAFSEPPLNPLGLPYVLPSYIFLGDNTQSASADIVLGDVALTTGVVPEPGTYALILGVITCGFAIYRRRRSVA